MPYPEGISYTHPSSPLYAPGPDDLPNYEPEAHAVTERLWAVVHGVGGFTDVALHELDAGDIAIREQMVAALEGALRPFRADLRLSGDRDARKLGEML